MATTLGEAVVAVGADTSGFESQTKKGVESTLSRSAKTMQNVGKSMTSVGKDLTAKVTLPLVAMAAVSVKTAANFETSMNVLQVASGASGKQLDSLSKLAIKLGADTVFSANEAAEAMVELAKGGFSPAEIAGGGVQAVMALAATEGLDLAEAATIAGNAMNAFGLKAENAGQIADALAGGANASSASVRSLAEGLGNVSALAVNMGLSLQDTVGTLSALDQAGIKGAEGGTALKSFLTSLIPTTKKAKDAMEEYGLSFVKSDGSMKSITNIAGQLQKTFGDMGEAERAAALQTIFGAYAKNAAAVIMKNGEKGIRGYIKATKDQGAAQQMADARMKGTAGAIEKMKGSLETAALVIGQSLAPIMVSVANFIGNLADKFSGLSAPVKQFILIGAAIAAALGPALIIIGSLISAIGAIAGVFAGVTAAVAAPIAAIVLLVAAVGILLAKSEAARAVVANAFSQIMAAIKPAIESITNMIKGQLVPAFQAMWPTLEKVGVILLKVFSGAVVGAIKGVINVIQGVVRVITGVVQVVSGILTGDWSRVWEGLKNIVMGALQGVLGAIQVYLNVGVLRLFRLGFTLLTGLIRGGWSVIKSVFTSSVSGIRTVMGKIVNFLLAPFRLAFNGIKALVASGWNAIKSLFTSNASGIRSVMGKIVNFLTAPFRLAFSALRAVVTGGWNAIKLIFNTYVTLVKLVVINGFGILRSVVSGYLNAVRSVVVTAWAAIRGAVVSAVGAIRGVVVKGFSLLRTVVSTYLNAVRSIVTTVWGAIRGAVSAAVGAVRNVVSKGFGGLRALVSGYLNAVRSVVTTVWGAIRGAVSNAVGAVRSAVSNGFNALKGIASSAWGAVRGAVSRGVSGVISLVRSIPGKAASALSGLGSTLVSAGIQLISGFISGITSKINDVKSTLGNLTSKLTSWKGPEKKDKKILYKPGQWIIGGLVKGLKSGYPGVKSALQDITKKLQDTGEKGAIKIVKGFETRLGNLGKSLDKTRKKLEKWQGIYKARLDQMNQYASQVGSNLVSSVFGPNEDETPKTFKNIIADLKKQKAEAQAFAKVMTQLKNLGLNKTSYDQIASEGVEGLAAAQALVKSGKAGVNQVNALQGSINQAAKKAGDTSAKYLYQAGVKAAEGMVNGLQKKENRLERQMTRLGNVLANAIIKAVNDTTKGLTIGKAPKKAKKHASGVLNSGGGWATVGERGRELVRLPGGSRVYPSHQTERMTASEKAPTKIEINQNYFGPTTGNSRLRELEWTMKYATKGRTGDGS